MSAEWIGATSLPVVPAKSLFRERREPSRADDAHLTPSQTHGVLSQADYMERTGNRVVLNLTGADSMRHVEDGDFISHLRSFQGGLEHSSLEGKVSAAYTVLAPRRQIESRYYKYLFKSSRYIQGLKTTTDQLRDGQSIRYAQFALLSLPEPGLSWQGQVADYLDRETEEIDAFIADQEELIALLEERRSAALLDALELDRGWPRGNIRRFAAMRTGHTPSRSTEEYWLNTSIPWFTLADVWQLRQGARFLGETKEMVSRLGVANSAAEVLPAGTVVLSRTASVGFTGIMPTPMATSQDYWNWVPGPQLRPEYLWYQFRAMRPVFLALQAGSTHKTIYQGDAAAMSITVPPLDTQRRICAELDVLMRELDATVADAREAIALSKERRAALISAAVTGQIDVTEKKRVLV